MTTPNEIAVNPRKNESVLPNHMGETFLLSPTLVVQRFRANALYKNITPTPQQAIPKAQSKTPTPSECVPGMSRPECCNPVSTAKPRARRDNLGSRATWLCYKISCLKSPAVGAIPILRWPIHNGVNSPLTHLNRSHCSIVFAPLKSALLRFASLRFAPMRCAQGRSASLRFAPLRSGARSGFSSLH